MFRATALVGLGARARLAFPVGLCFFGASMADCTKVTKPKGACWDAYKVVAAKTPGGPKGFACIGFGFCRKAFWQFRPNATILANHAVQCMYIPEELRKSIAATHQIGGGGVKAAVMMTPFDPRVETSGDVAPRATAPLHAQSAVSSMFSFLA